MRKCELNVISEHAYYPSEGGPIPVLPVKVFRKEIGRVIRVYALVDTGFSGCLIISHTLGDYLKRGIKAPDGTDTLFAAGGFGIPCEVYHLNVAVADSWFKIKAHLPRIADLGNILGRRILGRTNLCLRGFEKIVVAK